ncbi:MAG: formate dehydrogenase accessory sulfurtransferase FdhD [Pyrinomonadaceae bacterium]
MRNEAEHGGSGSREKLSVFVNRVSRSSAPIKEEDSLAVEEPLEIRIGYYSEDIFRHKAISITMRTPGNDFELAAGFLFTEGVIRSADQIQSIKYCGKPDQPKNTVRVDLKPGTNIDLKKMERHFYTTSSCGVCGKSSLDALSTGAQPIAVNGFSGLTSELVGTLPEKLKKAQTLFNATGGLHAAGLFSTEGQLRFLNEDVGRHNALDKLIGSALLDNRLPLSNSVLFLSGRASFELVQKAVTAKIPVIAAVSAPSSLAVAAAKEFNISLLGFVRNGSFNIYSGAERIIL